ncbi:VRR-NUC domain-containing protein, partial [Clostridium perfringens]
MKSREAQEQEIVIQWCNLQSCKCKELELIYHIPNGGKRNAREAASLKRQGVKSGVPDLHLPVPKNGYNSLYIEMKVNKNKCSENQNKWISKLLE